MENLLMKAIWLTALTSALALISKANQSHLEMHVLNKFVSDRLLNHLAIDEDLRYVYISTVNRLYQLDKSLTKVVANIFTGPKMDSVNCIPYKDDCKYNRTLTNNINRLLLIDKKGQRLIVCGSIYQGTCETRDISNISTIRYQVLNATTKPLQAIVCNNAEADCSSVGVITQGPTINNPVLYVAGSPGKGYYRNDNSITTYSLQFDESKENVLFQYAIELKGSTTQAQSVLQPLKPDGNNRDYKYTFACGNETGFVYFVFNRATYSDQDQGVITKFHSVIARICKSDPNYRSYLELPIMCGDEKKEKIMTAHYRPDTGNELSPDGTLYVAFSDAGFSSICSYRKSELDKLFYNTMEACYKYNGHSNETSTNEIAKCISDDENQREGECVYSREGDGRGYVLPSTDLTELVVGTNQLVLDYYPNYQNEVPTNQIMCGAYYLPSRITRTVFTPGELLFKKPGLLFTSITTDTVTIAHQIIVAFIGTREGTLLKVNLFTKTEYSSIEIGQELLPDMIWDADKSFGVPLLYVTTTNQVLRMRAALCKVHTSCDSCIASSDPYCGWCILETRCSTKDECKTAARDHSRWLGPDTNECIRASEPDPMERTLNGLIVTSVDRLPVLEAGRSYECVFDNTTVVSANVDFQSNPDRPQVTCRAPTNDQLPQSFRGEDYVNVSLNIRYESIDVVATTAVFYDCNLYGRKLMRHQPCAGCLSSRWRCRWCIGVNSCKPQDNLPGSTENDHCETNSSVCPTVRSVESTDRLIPVGSAHSITLTVANLPPDGTYHCEVSVDGEDQKFENIPTTRSIEDNTVTCVETKYNYTKNKSEAKANITLYWKLNFVVDYAQATPITLYKCSVDKSDCSRCVTTDPSYGCGWCSTTNTCSIKQSCSSNWITDRLQCPLHQLTSFIPLSGPLQGGTKLEISGIDLGTNASDIQSVLVAGQPCHIVTAEYSVSLKIVCETSVTQSPVKGKILVRIRNVTKSSSANFEYRTPKVSELDTKLGPKAGGTLIQIIGDKLKTGRNITVTIDGEDGEELPCNVVSEVTEQQLKCETSQSAEVRHNLNVSIRFDKFTFVLPRAFSYTENPQISKFWTLSDEEGKIASFLAGGRKIYFHGSGFLSIQSPMLQVTVKVERTRKRRRSPSSILRDHLLSSPRHMRKRAARANRRQPALTPGATFRSRCDVINATDMTCYTPQLSQGQGKNPSTNISDDVYDTSVQLKMDGWVIDGKALGADIKYYPNPQFEHLSQNEEIRDDEFLEITVYNLNEDAITKEEIYVKVGQKRCDVKSLDSDKLLCTVPARMGESKEVRVSVTIGEEEWDVGTMSYYVVPPALPPIWVFVLIGVVVLIIIVFAVRYFHKSRTYKANKNDFQIAMENMEKSVRADFRKAFAELSIEMSDLTSDIGDYGIPCLDYRTYVTNLFFPSLKYHPCMSAPDKSYQQAPAYEQGLSQFLLLLSNHNFLSTFIHTLEEQKSFSNRDKGYVASLLTVVLHQKLDYYTEMMKSLVSDLISRNLQKNPKLILRRSDSVAERMLSNWMYICLYPYLRDKAGRPIYLLLKAIKQQVSKGPLDAVTGKARYTLNDDRLLKEDIETEVLTLFVAPNTNSNDDEPVIVKVLDCDSVAQVKEKVMDAVYKRVPFSQRPTADQLDIEWRHGRSGHLVLPTNEWMVEPNSRWRKLLRITDYKVGDNATLALIPKQQEQRGSQDMSNTPSNNSGLDATALTPMLPNEENAAKLYHLSKVTDENEAKRESSINRDRQKYIPDLYLLRLINMKGILQNYVDEVIQTILDLDSIPTPVKHYFHFLDEIATKHGITDPEILHIWKTNSLPCRFWVTMLKNPESVFDIEKPDTISSSMAVISQTFIDACSVTEHKPTKDSPVNKQLYAKEIPTYKKMVQEYYKKIKEQPPVSDQDVNAFIAEISRKHACEFDVNGALKELWGFVNKYYEEIIEGLESVESPAVKQRLQNTYVLIDHAGSNGT